MTDDDAYLLHFYGTECVHCRDMDPLCKQLEKEHGVKIKKLEIWHNSENMKLYNDLDKGRCGGVPFFYNLKTHDFICGNCDYERLKAWALGE